MRNGRVLPLILFLAFFILRAESFRKLPNFMSEKRRVLVAVKVPGPNRPGIILAFESHLYEILAACAAQSSGASN
jgi:hypothetical protein